MLVIVIINLRTIILYSPEGEKIVKLRWVCDQATEFTDSLNDEDIDELLQRLEDCDPQNTNIVTINSMVDLCNSIINLLPIMHKCVLLLIVIVVINL